MCLQCCPTDYSANLVRDMFLMLPTWQILPIWFEICLQCGTTEKLYQFGLKIVYNHTKIIYIEFGLVFAIMPNWQILPIWFEIEICWQWCRTGKLCQFSSKCVVNVGKLTNLLQKKNRSQLTFGLLCIHEIAMKRNAVENNYRRVRGFNSSAKYGECCICMYFFYSYNQSIQFQEDHPV